MSTQQQVVPDVGTDPVQAIRRSLTEAVDEAAEQYERAKAHYEQAEANLQRLQGAQAALEGKVSTRNGKRPTPKRRPTLVESNGATAEPPPPAPVVEPDDEIVDLNALTWKEAILLTAQLSPGEGLKAEDVQERLAKRGFRRAQDPGSLNTIRAELAHAVNKWKTLVRTGERSGVYVFPKSD